MAAAKANRVENGVRRKAETEIALRGKRRSSLALDETSQRLLHELEVHQVELELQNEELRSARLETEATLARYAELFDFAPIGYAVLTPDGRIREINHAGATLLKYDRSRLGGTFFGAHVAHAHVAEFNALIRSTQAGSEPEKRDIELSVNGELRCARSTVTPLSRREPLVLVTFQDITEERTRQAKLASAEAELKEAQQRKDDFLAILSHELRNPLAPIMSSLSVLERADANSEQAKRAWRIIDRQVSHLALLVDDLLDVTRIARGKVQLNRTGVEVRQLVRQVLDDHRGILEARGITLRENLEGEVLWVDADAKRLVQAFSNVLGNSEKFTPTGGCITVSLRGEGTHALLRVQDTGIGIAPSAQAHLFEPFAQSPQAPDRAHGGLGLGLATVKGFVELHGGSVKIHSMGIGLGTEVAIRLPLRGGPAKSRPEPTEPKEPRRSKLLIIEDNVDAAESMRDELELSGHEVKIALDGSSGLDIARAFHPEIVICDLGLPGMDGFAVAKAFRADDDLCETYLVALSGYAQSEDRKRAREAGFDRHLGKPVGLETLEKIMCADPRRMES